MNVVLNKFDGEGGRHVAVHVVHTHANGAGGRFVLIHPVVRLCLQGDGVDLAYLRQGAGVRNEQAGDGFKIALWKIVANGALDFIQRRIAID